MSRRFESENKNGKERGDNDSLYQEQIDRTEDLGKKDLF